MRCIEEEDASKITHASIPSLLSPSHSHRLFNNETACPKAEKDHWLVGVTTCAGLLQSVQELLGTSVQ